MKSFTLKDVIFLALLSVVLLLVSSLVMPIVMFTQIFALRNLFGAFFFGMFSMIALTRVPKIGALTLVGFFTGAFLGFMSVIMLINNVLGAVLAELIVFILFRGYEKKSARLLASTLYIPLTLPITYLATLWIRGSSLKEQLGNPLLSILLAAGTIVISFLAALLGQKIAGELQKAGKL